MSTAIDFSRYAPQPPAPVQIRSDYADLVEYLSVARYSCAVIGCCIKHALYLSAHLMLGRLRRRLEALVASPAMFGIGWGGFFCLTVFNLMR